MFPRMTKQEMQRVWLWGRANEAAERVREFEAKELEAHRRSREQQKTKEKAKAKGRGSKQMHLSRLTLRDNGAKRLKAK
jgi:hypothetical protein